MASVRQARSTVRDIEDLLRDAESELDGAYDRVYESLRKSVQILVDEWEARALREEKYAQLYHGTEEGREHAIRADELREVLEDVALLQGAVKNA